MKLSKFNYFQFNNDNILLYNALRGTSSMIKFCGDEAKHIELCLKNPEVIDNTKEGKILRQYGFLVEDELDEDSLCESLAWKRMFNSALLLVILPTEDCNFRCSYCYESHKHGIMSAATSESIIMFVKKNIRKFSSVHVTWFGGEPLFNEETCKRIDEISSGIIKVCQSFKKLYEAGIITNGYNLTEETFLRLLKNRVFTYQVTIDGTNKFHDKYRALGGTIPSHDKIIENLLKIKASKKRFFKIIIRSNVAEDMIPSLKEHYDELYELFGNDDRFGFFVRPVGDWGGDIVKDISSELLSEQNFRKVYKLIQNMDVNLDFGRHLSFYDNCACSACYENSYIIGYDGKVHKCSCELDNDINGLGYIDTNGELVLKNEKVWKWVHKAPFDDKCKECFFAPVCGNISCPLYNNKLKVSTSETGHCPYEKVYIRETFSLLDKGAFLLSNK